MSRSDARSKSLVRRPSRTVPATVAALGLLTIGGLTVFAVVLRLVNGAWPPELARIAQQAADLTWGAAASMTIFGVAAVIGLAAIIAAVKPGRPSGVPLALAGPAPDFDTDYVISRRGIARLAAARAEGIDGVEKVATVATGGKVHLKVTTTSEQTDQISNNVLDAVTGTLAGIGLNPPPRISVTVRTVSI